MLDNYSLSDEDLAKMLVAIDEEGETVEEAVDAWMEDNEETWQAWIPEEPAT